MRVLYVLNDYYNPNTATTNRIIAFAKGFGELGIKTRVVFVLPNKDRAKVDEKFVNVEFIYIWEKIKADNKYFKHIYCRISLLKFFFRLKKGETVIFYNAMTYLWYALCKKDIKIYHERTERPDFFISGKGLLRRTNVWFYKKCCQRVHGLFAISPSIGDFFVNEFGVRRENVHIINMIVDSSRFTNTLVNNKKNTIAYCGVISEKKDGISDLLKAFKIVSELYEDIILTIIGDFENNSTQNVVSDLLKSLKLVDKVYITGVVSASQMPLLLSEAKILVLSRPQNEQAQYGFPTKLGEYLMTSNPVVITNVGDFKLYLTDKRDVVFAAPDNPKDFAEKILWVLDNYEKGQRIGLNGKKIALNSFNYRIEAQKVLNIVFESAN